MQSFLTTVTTEFFISLFLAKTTCGFILVVGFVFTMPRFLTKCTLWFLLLRMSLYRRGGRGSLDVALEYFFTLIVSLRRISHQSMAIRKSIHLNQFGLLPSKVITKLLKWRHLMRFSHNIHGRWFLFPFLFNGWIFFNGLTCVLLSTSWVFLMLNILGRYHSLKRRLRSSLNALY